MNFRTDVDSLSRSEAQAELQRLTGEASDTLDNLPTAQVKSRLRVEREKFDRRAKEDAARREPRAPLPRRESAAATPAPVAPLEGVPVFLQPPPIDECWDNPSPAGFLRWDVQARNGESLNIALLGATGTGKTTFARQFAAAHRRPLCVVNCGSVVEPTDWWGTMSLRDGNTHWDDSELVTAVQTPGCVIIFDELNRVALPKAANELIPVTDERRLCNIPGRGYVPVAAGVVFFATLNIGADYTGTEQADAAIFNRFAIRLNVPYLSPERESAVLVARTDCEDELAESLVMLANNVRGQGAPVSLRTLTAAAREVQYGASLDEAIVLTFLGDGAITEEQLSVAAHATLPGTQL